jgi:hypothetical protein
VTLKWDALPGAIGSDASGVLDKSVQRGRSQQVGWSWSACLPVKQPERAPAVAGGGIGHERRI